MAAAGYFLYSQSPSYTATATVQLPVNVEQNAPIVNGPNLQLITSDKASTAAAKALNRTDRGALARAISASYDADTGVVSISATTPNAADAAPIANAFASAYVDAMRAKTTNTLNSLQNQQTKLGEQIKSLSAQSRAHPNDQTIKTRLTNANTLYGSISNQVLQAQLAPAPASPLHAASRAASTAHSKAEVLGLGFVIGLLAGCGIALIRFQFDTRLHTVGDVEELSERPVLSEVPYARKYRRGSAVLPVATEPRSAFAESIRELRTSTNVQLTGSATPVLLLTSPAPFDGKTLLAANLAASWALSGTRTIVVCADLRKPRLHEFFGGSETDKGLAEILAGRTSGAQETASLLRDTQVEGLQFLPAGYPQGDPADGLASAAMGRVIEQVRSLADMVVIDAPPVLAVADAAITATHADGVVIVVRVKKTLQRALAETMKRLHAGKVNVLGIALNRVRSKVADSYGGYYRSGTRAHASDETSDRGTGAAASGEPAIRPARSDEESADAEPAESLNQHAESGARGRSKRRRR